MHSYGKLIKGGERLNLGDSNVLKPCEKVINWSGPREY